MKLTANPIQHARGEATSFAQCWTASRRESVGYRFRMLHTLRRREESNRPRWVPAVSVLVALLLFAAGVFFTFVPGPNWLFFIPALGLMAAEFGAIARLLDLAEKRSQPLIKAIRRLRSSCHPTVWKLVHVLIALAALYLCYRLFFE